MSARGQRWRLASWVALMLSLAACEPDRINLDLRGKVTDRTTGEPISGAPVVLFLIPILRHRIR